MFRPNRSARQAFVRYGVRAIGEGLHTSALSMAVGGGQSQSSNRGVGCPGEEPASVHGTCQFV